MKARILTTKPRIEKMWEGMWRCYSIGVVGWDTYQDTTPAKAYEGWLRATQQMYGLTRNPEALPPADKDRPFMQLGGIRDA
jgi:hypothetical protein